MKLIDLHSHTTASDGSLTPTELVNLAKERGLTALAITDHDTIAGIPEAIERANSLKDLEIIPGVEISADYQGEIHILGYFLNIHDKKFLEQLKKYQAIRDNRNTRMIEKFKNYNIHISMEDLLEVAKGDSIARPHFATILVKQGIVKDHKEAFKKYLSEGALCYVEKDNVHPAEAISVINENGGVAVLAHPVFLKAKTRSARKKVFNELKYLGLSGIEVYHSDHNEKDIQMFKELAEELGLCITGGSDFHGKPKPFINLGSGRGNLAISYQYLDCLYQKKMERNSHN